MAFLIPAATIPISLIAVFIPIFFMPGVIGLLFHEFAVVVGLAVSAAVSLTLVPMLESRLLPHATRADGAAWDESHADEETHSEPGTCIGRVFERCYRAVHGGYMASLDWTLGHRWLMLLGAAITLR